MHHRRRFGTSDYPERVDEETIRQALRRIEADLKSAEGRLRIANVDNLTYRKVFSALGNTRKFLRELDPQGD